MTRVPLAAVSLLTVLAVSACGTTSSTTSSGASPAPTRTPVPTRSTSPSATPAATPATPASTPPATRTHTGHRKAGELPGASQRGRRIPAEHLLGADDLPTLGDRAWSVAATGPDDGTAVGGCQKTALAAIGAVDAVRRSFTADDAVSATEVVGRFADPKSAWRAHQVLVAWRDDCEARVRHASVGPLEPVEVEAGAADSYRASFGRRGHAAGLGILRTGSYLTLVEVDAGAARYPERWEPARVAVRRIARTF